MKRTGNLGKPVNFANEKTGEIKPHYISIDRLTNEIVDIPADKVRIPNKSDRPTCQGKSRTSYVRDCLCPRK